jgi:hypothetical protein
MLYDNNYKFNFNKEIDTIKRFKMKYIYNDSVVFFIGKRRSGKTVLVSELLYYKRFFKKGIAICGTYDNVELYRKFIPSIFVYETLDIEKLTKIVNDQKRKIRKGCGKKMFIILDDCAYDQKFLNSPLMCELFQNGRHLKILLIITAQYCLTLKPKLRGNIDFIFICHEKNPKNREKLFDNFNPILETQKQFNHMMMKYTQDHNVLVIDNITNNIKLNENIYYYKAKLGRKFKMGKKGKWWKYNKKYYKIENSEKNKNQSNKHKNIKYKSYKKMKKHY